MRAAGLGLALALGACARELPDPDEPGAARAEEPVWFVEVGAASGLDFVHDSGHRGRFLFPEIASGGCGLFDADGDGDLDAYLVQSGAVLGAPAERPPNRLFANRGDGTFEDVTERAGVGDRGYGMGCATGDVDGDGDTDLYVTNLGPNVLYRNEGDGTFTDVTAAAGVGDPSWGTSAAFFDADGDGDLDLFVVNNVRWSEAIELECFADHGQADYCGPTNYDAPATDVLYRNEGDGTFTDVTAESGIALAFGNGLGVVCGDFDDDGDTDVYVANDGMPNQLWTNLGGMRFEDRGLVAGVAVNEVGASEAGMGVCAEDLEDDGDLDLFVVHLRGETNTYYRNLGRWFEDATSRAGLSAESLAMTGFGVALRDFDHDGWLDAYVANGRVKLGGETHDPADPYAEPDSLYRGLPGGARFAEVRPSGGARLSPPGTGRGAAFGDVDGDGDVDVLVANRDGRPHLLRNERGGDGRWILFHVREVGGGHALGARVTLRAGARTLRRDVRAAFSYLATNDPRVHVGLGALERVEDVTVRWTDGALERFGGFDAGRVVELRRGAGKSP